ncbi:unnamed protein product, partial [Tilletia caries]
MVQPPSLLPRGVPGIHMVYYFLLFTIDVFFPRSDSTSAPPWSSPLQVGFGVVTGHLSKDHTSHLKSNLLIRSKHGPSTGPPFGSRSSLQERDEDGKRVFEHRWNPTTFGGGVDITTIPGVVELLEQHRAEFGIIQDPMCLIAEAMSEYGRYCAARLRLETLIETHIKAGLTTAVNTSSPVSSLHASEDNFAAFYGSEASCNGDDHVHIPAQPTTEEALTIGDIDDESTDSSSS